MSPLRLLAVLGLAVTLTACDSAGSGADATSGTWAGTARFEIDTVYVNKNFRVITDYEARYEFDISQDEDGLVLGTLKQYNTGTFILREPRDQGEGPTIREVTLEWDDELVQEWPVYGTFVRPELELDLPEAEALDVFPKDLWTFTVVGDRARLNATRIDHGYRFPVFEDDDVEYTIILSPTKNQEFSMRRQ